MRQKIRSLPRVEKMIEEAREFKLYDNVTKWFARFEEDTFCPRDNALYTYRQQHRRWFFNYIKR